MLDYIIQAFHYFSFFYFLSSNLIYLVLNTLAFFQIRSHFRYASLSEDKLLFRTAALFKPVSILAPAYNEELTIIENVRSLLNLNYPDFEVILINDGSRDRTMEVLIETFGLERVDRAAPNHLPTKQVRGVYLSDNFENLIVIDKENGGKADALNAGINYSRYPLFAAIDSDSLLEKDSLLKMVRPFLEDSKTVAVGGVIRVVNGSDVKDGEVVRIGLPTGALPLFQIVEYLRAFLFGRVGWGSLNLLLVISGAFGMFNKNVVISVGGYCETVGEDIELVVRLHRRMREARKPYRIRYLPSPVCWTEAPDSLTVLGRQRNRWNRGLMDSLWRHRVMFLNPRYGAIGLISIPFNLVVEGLGWVFEFFGMGLFIVSFALGTVEPRFAVAFFSVSILLGVIVSVSALLVEEFSIRRFPNVRMVLVLILFGALENFGYRQINAWWRMMGTIDFLRGKKSWGVITRKGFGKPGAGKS